MNKYQDLYEFIEVAKNNRKYAENTANGLKSALKIFEKELNLDEINSVDLVEDNIEEIFINAVSNNKDKGIGSLNTYKARLLKVINDYQKYGIDPSKMQGWATKLNKTIHTKVKKKDTLDKRQDNHQIGLSEHVNTPVHNCHKIDLALRPHLNFSLVVPRDVSHKEIDKIKKILDSLVME